MKETFKVLDCNPKYMVSDLGNIMHIKSKNILKGQVTLKGYRSVMLSFFKKERRVYLVHRLIAQTFILNPENKPYVNHKDGDKLNNSLSNLEWCTAKENDTHARQTKLKDQGHPIQVINLSTNEVKVYQSIGEAQVDLNINRACIHRCLKLTYGKDIYKSFKFSYV